MNSKSAGQIVTRDDVTTNNTFTGVDLNCAGKKVKNSLSMQKYIII
jgi:hypothetical protein